MSDFNYYHDFVRGILKKLPVLKTKQLIKAITNYYYEDDLMSEEKAQLILNNMQSHGYLLLSENGWAMTKGYYKTITNDRFLDNLASKGYYYLPEQFDVYDSQHKWQSCEKIEDLIDEYHKNLINCFWVIVDMFPEGYSFMITQEPYNAMFISTNQDGEYMLYEVMYVHYYSMRFIDEILKNVCKAGSPKDDNLETEGHDFIHKIVILEEESSAYQIPYTGIDYICVIDDKTNTNYRIVEDRTKQDRWKDIK